MKLSAQTLLEHAADRYCGEDEKLDFTQLAKICDLPYSNVYAPLMKGRSPNADIWLKLMKGLGAVTETKKGWFIRKV